MPSYDLVFSSICRSRFFYSINRLNDVSNGVVAFDLEFDTSEYHDNLFSEFDICFPDRIRRSVVKRRAEYLAGRVGAKFCLNEFGISLFDVLTGSSREPIWPDNFTGSISHTKNHACVMTAQIKNFVSIGVDVEAWMDLDRSLELAYIILSQSELNVGNSMGFSYSEFITLVFSAKESLFKALFMKHGTYYNFDNFKAIFVDTVNTKIGFKLINDTTGVRDDIFVLNYSILSYGVRTAVYLTI